MYLFTTPQISILTRPVCTCLPHHKFPSSLYQYVPVYHTTNFHPHSFRIHLPMKMEQTQCSETSAIKHFTPVNNPKEYTQRSEFSLRYPCDGQNSSCELAIFLHAMIVVCNGDRFWLQHGGSIPSKESKFSI